MSCNFIPGPTVVNQNGVAPPFPWLFVVLVKNLAAKIKGRFFNKF